MCVRATSWMFVPKLFEWAQGNSIHSFIPSINLKMAMSLTKFQLCLNHESPGIVKTGLIEFSNQVLKDHDVVGKFGCCGRAYSKITKDLVTQTSFSGPVRGILQSYIQSSPRLDELFVLWQLSGRDDDDSLCIAHTRCMAVLLFCTGSIPHLQKLIT